MKKLYYMIGLGLMSLATLSSCDDILDKEPLDKFTNTNFWKTASNVEGYANSFYGQFSGYNGLFYFKTLSDDQAGNAFTDWDHKSLTTSNSTWKNCYAEIRRANIMIENIPNIIASDEEKNHWLGVGRLMRAYNYHQLVRAFGDVPYTEKALNVSDEDVLYGPRENRDKVMDNVLEDLKFAAENIYESKSKISWSRNMANAMKADICLWEGTFRKYRSSADGQPAADKEGATRFLQACKEACQAIMAKDYTLNASYQGNYNSINLGSNPEMIFYKAYKKNVMGHSLIDYTCTSTQMHGMTKDAFESYLMKDGSIMKEGDDVAPLVEGKLSLEDILAARDGRLAQTIDNVLLYQGNANMRFDGDMEQTSSTGYGVSKYDNGTLPLEDRNQGSKNYTHAPIFWLSVVYLNYAEACAELGAITQQDVDQTINKLRDRAGVAHLNINNVVKDSKNNRGVSDLIWEIRRERRCELMFDNWFRYWDLVRWHMLDKLDSSKYPDVLLGANVKNDPACKADKVGDYVDGHKGMGNRKFDNKYYLYPVPENEKTLNPELGQNPGW